MFPEIRRKDRILSPENTEQLLQKGEYGVLSTMGEEYPYGVPVSYVYENGAVYIHCAVVGSKLENITRNQRFCRGISPQIMKARCCLERRMRSLPGKSSGRWSCWCRNIPPNSCRKGLITSKKPTAG